MSATLIVMILLGVSLLAASVGFGLDARETHRRLIYDQREDSKKWAQNEVVRPLTEKGSENRPAVLLIMGIEPCLLFCRNI